MYSWTNDSLLYYGFRGPWPSRGVYQDHEANCADAHNLSVWLCAEFECLNCSLNCHVRVLATDARSIGSLNPCRLLHIMKTLVVYFYKEEYDTITNLAFFLKHGVIHSDNYHYAFLINNLVCSLDIPETNTIKVFKRSQNEYDLPSYKWFFETMLKESPSYFDQFGTFYFLNSSCVGPFLPTIVESNWIELFNKKLEKYDLVAPIVEFPPDSRGFEMLGLQSNLNVPFLHSYMFGTNVACIYLLKIS